MPLTWKWVECRLHHSCTWRLIRLQILNFKYFFHLSIIFYHHLSSFLMLHLHPCLSHTKNWHRNSSKHFQICHRWQCPLPVSKHCANYLNIFYPSLNLWLWFIFFIDKSILLMWKDLSLQKYFSVNVPKVDYYLPEREGLPGTRNFYLQTEKNVSVGVW